MLQTIRSKTHGVVAWIVIILIGFVFAIWGIEGYMSSDTNEVAKVNGKIITAQEFERTYQQLFRQQLIMAAMQGGKKPDENLIQQQAFSGLISEKMLSTVAQQQGFAVGRDQVDEIIRSLQQFQKDGVFAPEIFETTVNNMGFTVESFRAAVQNDLMIGQVRSSIVDSAFVLPYEFDRTVELLEQKRDVQYLLIPAAQYLPQTNVTDENITQFYEARSADFMLPERLSIEYVRLNAANLTIADPDDKMLQDFYNAHLTDYTEPEKRHAAHILITSEKVTGEGETIDTLAAKIMQELQQGADFAQLAKTYSADPGSAEQGGDLGWFGRGVMVPEFEEAVFTAQSGTLVGPVKTDFGLHIIKVIGIEPQTVKPFDSVKDAVRTAWLDSQRQTQFDTELAQLDTLSFENSDSLQAAADALNLTIEKTDLFSREHTQALGEIDQPEVIAAAFSDTVLLEDRNSEVVTLSPTDVIVLRKLTHETAQVQPLEEVKEAIKTHLASEQAAKMAHENGDAWLAQLKGGTPADQLDTKLAWVKTDKTNRYNREVPPEILNKAFTLQPQGMDLVPVGREDYALVLVGEVYPGQIDPDFEQAMREEYTTGLTSFKGEMDYQLYVYDAEKHSDIEVNMDIQQ